MENTYKKKIQEYVVLAIILLCIFQVYLSTLHPVFKENDSPETITAAYTLGIAHPPGYPIYNLFGKLFTMIAPGNAAFAVNTLAAFLMILTLFMTYLLLKKISYRLFGRVNLPAVFAALIILGFSSLIWEQSIEAKGGIYVLNILFLSVLLYALQELLYRFDKKMLYVIFFIFGLGLSNHWPSTIILLPAAAYVVFKSRQSLNRKNIGFSLLFLVVGLSPYLYLPIRAAAGPVLRFGNPVDLNSMLWHILRKDYVNSVGPNFAVFLYQLKEFGKVFLFNYSLLTLFLIPGIYIAYKKCKKILFMYVSVFLLVSIAVVFFNKTKLDTIWLMDIFLMPAEYAVLPLIFAGLYFVFENLKKPAYIFGVWFMIIVAFGIMFKNNLDANNCSTDYLEYDYANNIIKTMKPGAYFLGDGEYNTMPFYYISHVQKKEKASRFITSLYLNYQWGIDDFISGSGLDVSMKKGEMLQNAINLTAQLAPKSYIYKSNVFHLFDNANIPYPQEQDGVIIKIGDSKDKYFPAFQTYSYRGIFEKFVQKKKYYYYFIAQYPVCMVNQANKLTELGYNYEAIKLYKKSLAFPVKLANAYIYYNLSIAYKNLNDTENEYAALIKSVNYAENLMPVWERLAIILNQKNQYTASYNAAQAAYKYGSRDLRITSILRSSIR